MFDFILLKTRLKRTIKRLAVASIILLVIVIAGFLLPEETVNPVKGATSKDWHKKSFWYYPWGRSGVHRGVDIFAPKHRPVLAATHGIVISTAERTLGGKTITVLGAKWRLHYYAHLQSVDVHRGDWVNVGETIGSVGDSGNAVGKAPHLHYAIKTLFPYFWQRDDAPYGSQKIWYIDPTPRL